MRLIPITLVLAAGLACSEKTGAYDATDDSDGWGAADTGFGPSEPGDDDDGAPVLPPETEDDARLLRPAQSDIHIFVANPDRDTVTRVNVLTQAVRTVRVGAQPSVVAITPDYTAAVVFNKGDDTVSVLDALTLDEEVIPVRDNLNALKLSPNGRWAVLWHDVDAEEPDDPPPTGAASYHEISLVDVIDLAHYPAVVGFNPKDVTFTPDGDLVLVVADADLGVVRFDGPTPDISAIPIADPLSPPVAEEVLVSDDGAFAFVRQRGVDALTVVDLELGDVTEIPVGLDPTDIDLTQDGSGLVVVSRAAREVALFDTTNPFAAPVVTAFPADVPLGAVLLGPDDRGILYTTATQLNRYATWDITLQQMQLRPLVKPLESLTRTPTGASLLAIHTRSNNPDGSTPEPYRDQPAVSLIDLDDFRANTIRLADDVTGFVNSEDGRRGYLVMEGQPYLEVLDYTTLIYDEIPLRSDPVFVGVLPDLDTSDDDEPPAWVSQQHDLGRISFYDPDDGTLETITGFELNGEIEE